MRAICVDDEVLLLEALKRAVEASPDIEEVFAFDDEYDALQWLTSNRADAAFLDIRLHQLNGMELAEHIRTLHPKMPIVFCTGFREYAVDAFEMHASGYLTKPIRAEAVQREIDHIKETMNDLPLLHAHCFGTFEIYANGKQLSFRRAKTKEMLAYLIDRRGAGVTARDLYALLWEENLDEKRGLNYLHQIASDLRKSLRSVGAESVFVYKNHGYSVDTSLIDCDYYRFLDGEETAIRRFTGEYMSNYSWAEVTAAYLQRKAGGVPENG